MFRTVRQLLPIGSWQLMLRIPMALQTSTAARFCGYARTRTRVCLLWHVFGEVVNRNAKDGHRRTIGLERIQENYKGGLVGGCNMEG